jgi:hypothetical protein
MYFCVKVIDLPLSMIFLLDYGTVSTLWYLILMIHSNIQVTSLYGRARTTPVLYLVDVLALMIEWLASRAIKRGLYPRSRHQTKL